MSAAEAIVLAESQCLDLIEITQKTALPVCKIMDYGKYKYDQSKSEQRARRNQATIEIKEIKFRPKTDDHDFDFKVKHVREFIAKGNKVKLVVSFKGREIIHPESGREMLQAVTKAVADVAFIEQFPVMENKKMSVLLSPKQRCK